MSDSGSSIYAKTNEFGVDLSQYGVLVVDDESFMLHIVSTIVSKMLPGQLERAASGQAALNILSRYRDRIGLVVSDCNMKPINGLEFLKIVRSGGVQGVARDLPFIMVTGHGDEPMVKQAIEMDVHGYCVKPVAPEKLASVVKRAITQPIDLKPALNYRSLKLVKPTKTPYGESKF